MLRLKDRKEPAVLKSKGKRIPEKYKGPEARRSLMVGGVGRRLVATSVT